jgi:asparagine synthase (glutamine-hydrolysing)
VTALAARHKGEGVNTYSIGFEENGYDESEYASRVSQHCRTVHHQLRLSHSRFSDLLPRMIWHNDEPLDFANSVHIFALSELAKRSVTVVLTGEGSDELFAGYPRYRIPDVAGFYRLIPGVIRRQLARWTGDHRLAKLERYASETPDDILLFNSSYVSRRAAVGAAPGLPFTSADVRRQLLGGSATLGLDAVSRLSLLDQETFLVSILHRQDKMSMAAGIESRVPFMDYRIVEFANRLPRRFKIRGSSGKAIVKDCARRVLPPEIVNRRKSGFGVPLDRWFRSNEGLGERVTALSDSPGADLFDRTTLRRLVAEHRDGVQDHSELLWTALNLTMWREAFRC